MRSKFTSISKATAVIALLAMFSPLFTFSVNAQQMMRNASAGKLSGDQKILHALNRLGFGARPGDVERVRSMGLEKYIENQLNPDSIPDSEVQAKLENYEILKMPTSEIFAKYPNPGALLRMLEGNGRNNRRNAAQNSDQAMESEKDQQTVRRERRTKLIEIYQKYDLKPANQIMTQVQSSRILRAAYSERQLEEAMVDFWANHFNVYSRKAATRWYIPSYERDVIRKHALGNFKDLVVNTAKHPAMLFYLDNFQSVSPDATNAEAKQRLNRLMVNGRLKENVRNRFKRQGLSDEQIDQRIKRVQDGAGGNQRGINENYARELMELHTLGVDGGYSQNDIKEVAKAFTGWTIFDSRGYRKAAGNMIKDADDRQAIRQARQLGISPNTESGTFVFVDKLHDQKPKTVLGQTINEGGMKDGLKVIDVLVSHPSTAKFIAKKLAVKFVNDAPSEAYVDRIASAFQRSNGDIKTTLRAMISDKEFYSPDNYRSKIKTPFELLASSLRALNANTNGSNALIGLLNRMGEPLYGYQAPTGYPDTAQDWVNTGALLERMNFAVALSSNRIPQTNVNLRQFEAGGQNQILDRAIENILHGEISPSTRSTLLKQMDKPLPKVTLTEGDTMPDDESDSDSMAMQNQRRQRGGNNRQARLRDPSGNPEVFKVIGLILGSPDFQRQ